MNDKIAITERSILIAIDVQRAWKDPSMGRRNNKEVERNIAHVIEKFRENRRTVIHVRHSSVDPNSPFREGKPTFEFMEEAVPHSEELVITKHVNSALIGTDLESILRKRGDPQVFYIGLTTDHCVSTTARMSGNLGFESFVIADACATYDRKGSDGNVIPAEVVHMANLASIDGEFAKVVKSEQLTF